MAFVFSSIVRWFVVIYLVFAATQWLLRNKAYTISPKEFKSMATKAQATGSAAAAVTKIAADLRRMYGSSIEENVSWLPFSIGNLDMKIYLMHGSVTEYAAVIGAPLATSGRIGFHWSNSTCTVLTGIVYRVGDTAELPNKETFKAGANFRHGQFESHIYSLEPETYVACYGRGIIPLSGVWAGANALLNGEPFAAALLTKAYLHGAYINCIAAVQNTFHYYRAKAAGEL